MKLDCVLSASTYDKEYAPFIPYFIKFWKHLYPNIDVKVVFINDSIPQDYIEYSDHLILFDPQDDIPKPLVAQLIRLLYPALLNYKNAIIISDIDMLPLNNTYYTHSIKNIEDHMFVSYRKIDSLLNNNQISMCYNAAINKTWSNVFKINDINDIHLKLKNIWLSNPHYLKGGQGWGTDQNLLYTTVSKSNNFIHLDDDQTFFQRGKDDHHCIKPIDKSGLNQLFLKLLQKV